MEAFQADTWNTKHIIIKTSTISTKDIITELKNPLYQKPFHIICV